MQSISQIHDTDSYPSVWKVFFLAAVVLGLYLSFIIAGSSRLRNQQGILLGLYTAGLSILLLNLTIILFPVGVMSGFLHAAGLAALYLIGPFSYFIHNNQYKHSQYGIRVFHILPAILITLYYTLYQSHVAWLYRGGILYFSIYLIVQTVQLFRVNPGHQNWKKIFTIWQVGSFLVICITSLTRHFCFVSSVCLAFLILTVWFRLLRTAYMSYSTDNL